MAWEFCSLCLEKLDVSMCAHGQKARYFSVYFLYYSPGNSALAHRLCSSKPIARDSHATARHEQYACAPSMRYQALPRQHNTSESTQTQTHTRRHTRKNMHKDTRGGAGGDKKLCADDG